MDFYAGHCSIYYSAQAVLASFSDLNKGTLCPKAYVNLSQLCRWSNKRYYSQKSLSVFLRSQFFLQDTPGFIVNRLLVPYLMEAVRLYERGICQWHLLQGLLKRYSARRAGILTGLCFLKYWCNDKKGLGIMSSISQ